MRQRGKPSVSALSVVPAMPHQRMAPPSRLNDEQAEIWREIVAGKPADWFGADNAPLLESYCTTVWECRRVDAAMRLADPCLDEHAGLARTKATLQQQAMTLATKMRLTNQARQEPKTAGVHARRAAQSTAKPWEFAG